MSRAPLFAPRHQLGQPIGETPDWQPHERPMIPGSPATLDMSPGRRLKYGLVGLLLGLTASLGTALVVGVGGWLVWRAWSRPPVRG